MSSRPELWEPEFAEHYTRLTEAVRRCSNLGWSVSIRLLCGVRGLCVCKHFDNGRLLEATGACESSLAIT